jgi:hypothetical protein
MFEIISNIQHGANVLGKVVFSAIRCGSIHIYERDGELKHSSNALLIYDAIVLYFSAQKQR